MSRIDEIRALTKAGEALAAETARDEEYKKAAENKRMIEWNRTCAREKVQEILKKIEEAARKGNHSACIFVGEAGTYSSYYIDTLEKRMNVEGFKVEFEYILHEPHGSDPYRYDTYTDIYMRVLW